MRMRGSNISTKTPIKCSRTTNRLMFNYSLPNKRSYFSASSSGQISTEQTLDYFIEVESKQCSQNFDSIDLLKILCKKLKLIHDNNKIHGDIKPKNIKIFISTGNGQINAKLYTPRNKYKGSLCWKSPEAIEALNIHDEYTATKEDDIFSIGCIFYYVLTNGKHPFLFKLVNILDAKTDYSGLQGDSNKIYLDLIELMLKPKKSDRPTIAFVLNHPIFWDSVKTSNFYTAIKPIFSAKDSPNIKIDDFETIRTEIKNALEAKSAEVFGTDWLLKLCDKVQDFEKERQKKNHNNRIRNSTSLIKLLKYIADKARHWDEWPLQIRPDQPYIEYFSKKFPLLLIYTYNELRPLKSIIELQNFY